MTRRKSPVPKSPMIDEPIGGPIGGPVGTLVTDTGAEVVVGLMGETPIAPDGQPEMQPSDPPDASDPAPAPTTSRKQARSPGVFGPVIGGFLAAVAGFGLAHFNLFGLQPSDRSDEIAALTERQANMTSGMAELQDRIAALEARPEPEGPDLSRLDDLDQRLKAIEAAPPVGTADLAARLAALEKAVATLPKGNGVPAEIEAALARLAELQAAADAQAAATAELARVAEEARVLAALAEAMETGKGFEDELAAITNPDLKAALAPHTAGVTPLAQLQATFPEAARATLQLARRTDGDDGWGSRLTDFLADQTGARSVTPRDGDDPDAILSRAEFALAEGRLSDALTELSTLAPDIRTPLEDWIAKAAARVAVDDALTEAM